MRKNQVDADSPSVNASSTKESTAKGGNTHGILNQHPTTTATSTATATTATTSVTTAQASTSTSSSTTRSTPLFRIGVSVDRNKRWRRTMEDAHAFVYGYGGIKGQGFFSVFDGHAGKHAAEWCGNNFHQQLLEAISRNPSLPVPDIFADAFHTVDEKLRILAEENQSSSGCTAVVAFLRLEDSEGNPVSGKETGGVMESDRTASKRRKSSRVSVGGIAAGEDEDESGNGDGNEGGKRGIEKRKSSFKDLIIGSRPNSPNSKDKEKIQRSNSSSSSIGGNKEGIFSSLARRVRQVSGQEKIVTSVSNGNSLEEEEVEKDDKTNVNALTSSVSAPASTPDQSRSTELQSESGKGQENQDQNQNQPLINQDQAPSESPTRIHPSIITPSSIANSDSDPNSDSNPNTTPDANPNSISDSNQASNSTISATSTSTSSDLASNPANRESKSDPSRDADANEEEEAEDDSSLYDVYQNRENPEEIRRVLYTANVGDARAVLCRAGKAVRLTYDHKGSDPQESKRITDAGGFVMNNRVNGVLAVTRSLGDSAMKEFVVGSPYTTETTVGKDDSFLIVACDGLWDVADDQDAVDLIRDIRDPQEASEKLLEHALSNFSTDNTSVMVIRLDHQI